MDDKGRLHMPGFVGETFEETGALKPTPVGKILTIGSALGAAEVARMLEILDEKAKAAGLRSVITEGEQQKGTEFDPSSDELIREHMSRKERRAREAIEHTKALIKARP